MLPVRYTLTSDIPTYCVGLWDSHEEAEAFVQTNGLDGEHLVATPIFFA